MSSSGANAADFQRGWFGPFFRFDRRYLLFPPFFSGTLWLIDVLWRWTVSFCQPNGRNNNFWKKIYSLPRKGLTRKGCGRGSQPIMVSHINQNFKNHISLSLCTHPHRCGIDKWVARNGCQFHHESNETDLNVQIRPDSCLSGMRTSQTKTNGRSVGNRPECNSSLEVDLKLSSGDQEGSHAPILDCCVDFRLPVADERYCASIFGRFFSDPRPRNDDGGSTTAEATGHPKKIDNRRVRFWNSKKRGEKENFHSLQANVTSIFGKSWPNVELAAAATLRSHSVQWEGVRIGLGELKLGRTQPFSSYIYPPWWLDCWLTYFTAHPPLSQHTHAPSGQFGMQQREKWERGNSYSFTQDLAAGTSWTIGPVTFWASCLLSGPLSLCLPRTGRLHGFADHSCNPLSQPAHVQSTISRRF